MGTPSQWFWEPWNGSSWTMRWSINTWTHFALTWCSRTLYLWRFMVPIINLLQPPNAGLWKLHLCEDHQRHPRVWSNGWKTSSASCQVQLFGSPCVTIDVLNVKRALQNPNVSQSSQLLGDFSPPLQFCSEFYWIQQSLNASGKSIIR